MHMFRTMPVLALLPLFIVWFGIGEKAKVLVIAWAVTFPIYINLFAGIRVVDPKLVEAGEVLGLSRLGQIRHVILPGALPQFLTGLRLAHGRVLARAGRGRGDQRDLRARLPDHQRPRA